MVRIEEESSEAKAELVGMTLDELARSGAQRMLRTALEAEVSAYVAAHREQRADDGTALVVRQRVCAGAQGDGGLGYDGGAGAAGR